MEIDGVKLHGWCSPAKARYLKDWISNHKPQNILEVGVFGGASLIPMALEAKKYGGKAVGIDPWDNGTALEAMVNPGNVEWWEKVNLSAVKESFDTTLKKLKVDNVEVLVGTADDFKERFPNNHFGVFSVDGNHGLPCMRDAQNYLRTVEKGGLIACDDENWIEGGIFTVQRMIQWLLENGCTYNCSIDHCAMLVKE